MWVRFSTQEAQKHKKKKTRVLACSFAFPKRVISMGFCVLVPKTLKKKKTLKWHVFSNVVSFSHMKRFACILVFFYLTMRETINFHPILRYGTLQCEIHSKYTFLVCCSFSLYRVLLMRFTKEV